MARRALKSMFWLLQRGIPKKFRPPADLGLVNFRWSLSEAHHTSTRPITWAQNLKVGKGKVAQADSSAQHLPNEREKLRNASPRRSQRFKTQRAQHIQRRAGKEPSCETPDYKTKVPVGSGVPETATQNGTSNAQASINYKFSGARGMKSHMHWV
ncbi:hypothetical protein B0H13DRAFT_1853180 [Mycena leptocephala]|nr:hypothetical protein B0H13DRAFT_1853180 [Mycena leptocephala]